MWHPQRLAVNGGVFAPRAVSASREAISSLRTSQPTTLLSSPTLASDCIYYDLVGLCCHSSACISVATLTNASVMLQKNRQTNRKLTNRFKKVNKHKKRLTIMNFYTTILCIYQLCAQHVKLAAVHNGSAVFIASLNQPQPNMKPKAKPTGRAKPTRSNKNKNNKLQNFKETSVVFDKNMDTPKPPESRKPFKISEAFMRITNEIDIRSQQIRSNQAFHTFNREKEFSPQRHTSQVFMRYEKETEHPANNPIPSQEMIPETPENVSNMQSFSKGFSRPMTVKKSKANTTVKKNKANITSTTVYDCEILERDEYDMEAFVDNEIKRKLAMKKKNANDLFDTVTDIDIKFDTAFEKLKGNTCSDSKKMTKKPKIKIVPEVTPKKRRKIKPKKLQVQEFHPQSDILPSLVIEKVQRGTISSTNTDLNIQKMNLDSIFSQNTQSKRQETIQNVIPSSPMFESDDARYEVKIPDHPNETVSPSPILMNKKDKKKRQNSRKIIIEDMLKNSVKNILGQYNTQLEKLNSKLCSDLQETIEETLNEAAEKKLVK
ncbi:uncharacterized protein LOC143909240 [Arctopsyche grandis]|uniref:uncharacterized protein LOC143909240 n=1 Tax=Arctopsyche grandis TaxID=121162 RepID=UPI00406DA059